MMAPTILTVHSQLSDAKQRAVNRVRVRGHRSVHEHGAYQSGMFFNQHGSSARVSIDVANYSEDERIHEHIFLQIRL